MYKYIIADDDDDIIDDDDNINNLEAGDDDNGSIIAVSTPDSEVFTQGKTIFKKYKFTNRRTLNIQKLVNYILFL